MLQVVSRAKEWSQADRLHTDNSVLQVVSRAKEWSQADRLQIRLLRLLELERKASQVCISGLGLRLLELERKASQVCTQTLNPWRQGLRDSIDAPLFNPKP